MSELSFEQMLEESLKTIRNGEVVEGTVIDVKEDEIILNIGYKADGILTKRKQETGRSFRKQRSSESKSFSGTEWRTECSDRRSKSIHSCKSGF